MSVSEFLLGQNNYLVVVLYGLGYEKKKKTTSQHKKTSVSNYKAGHNARVDKRNSEKTREGVGLRFYSRVGRSIRLKCLWNILLFLGL